MPWRSRRSSDPADGHPPAPAAIGSAAAAAPPPIPPPAATRRARAPPPPPALGTGARALGPAPSTSAAGPRRWPMALGVIVVGLLLLGVVALVTDRLQSDGPEHPEAWDPRVEHLVRFVEDERGLDFDHPVYVDFLTGGRVHGARRRATRRRCSDGGADRARPLRGGAPRPRCRLRGARPRARPSTRSSDGGTLAFYDPVSERVRVRGTEMTVGLEVTLVHELTHALQDQHFDLERLYDDQLDNGAATAFRGPRRGRRPPRGGRVHRRRSSPRPSRTPTTRSTPRSWPTARRPPATCPPFVSATLRRAATRSGSPSSQMLAQPGRQRRRRRGVRASRPSTEEHLFDPASYLADGGGRRRRARLRRRCRAARRGTLRRHQLVPLPRRADRSRRWPSTRPLGWNGDASPPSRRTARRACGPASVGDTADDEDEMADALDDVGRRDARRARPRSIEVDGHPGLEACDPGEDVDLELTGRSETSLYLPNLWGYLVADARVGARCRRRPLLRRHGGRRPRLRARSPTPKAPPSPATRSRRP